MVRKANENGKEVIDIFAELQDEPVQDDVDGETGSDPAPAVAPSTLPAAPAEPAATPVSDPVQDRIRALEEQLRHALAARDTGAQVSFTPPPALAPQQPTNDDAILIHFVESGFTALGSIWYRGQELEFPAGSPNYADTVDRNGKSWLDLRHDENAQIDKFGVVMFKDGPWRGKTYADVAEGRLEHQLKPLKEGGRPPLPPTQDELHQAAAAERRRMRRPPRVDA